MSSVACWKSSIGTEVTLEERIVFIQEINIGFHPKHVDCTSGDKYTKAGVMFHWIAELRENMNHPSGRPV